MVKKSIKKRNGQKSIKKLLIVENQKDSLKNNIVSLEKNLNLIKSQVNIYMNLFLSVILLNLLFVVSAIGKIKNFSGTVKSLKNVFWVKNLPNWFFNLSIVCVIILLLVAPSTILYSLFNPKYNIYSRFSCYGIIAFTIMATLVISFSN